jgi:hypothetical protein
MVQASLFYGNHPALFTSLLLQRRIGQAHPDKNVFRYLTGRLEIRLVPRPVEEGARRR